MKSLRLRWAPALLLFLPLHIQAADVCNEWTKAERFIGVQREFLPLQTCLKEQLAKVFGEGTGSWFGTRPDEFAYGMAVYQVGGKTFILLRLITKRTDTHPSSEWIADALEVKPARPSQQFLLPETCEKWNPQRPYPLALVLVDSSTKDRTQAPALRAWRIDVAHKKLKDVSVKGLSCNMNLLPYHGT